MSIEGSKDKLYCRNPSGHPSDLDLIRLLVCRRGSSSSFAVRGSSSSSIVCGSSSSFVVRGSSHSSAVPGSRRSSASRAAVSSCYRRLRLLPSCLCYCC
ncbi:unnamed protein product [Citrullus colocynthis]|uniref:Uncharacterized protein n=1 Tax=Citrullus colocynthis TaxID=252529 RepID=A0ABP0ZB96_9ROSI